MGLAVYTAILVAVEVVLAAKGAAGFGQLTENSKSALCFSKYLPVQ
jgi:hypothetical protein